MLQSPARVEAWVLMDTEADRAPWRTRNERRIPLRVIDLFGVRSWMGRVVTRRMFCPDFRGMRPEVVAEWNRRVVARDGRAFRLAAAAVDSRPSLVHRLGEVKVPTLLVWGGEDGYTPWQPVDGWND